MSALLSRVEVEKLADDLSVPAPSLAALEELSVEAIRSLRQQVQHARYVAHEKRLRRLAAMSKMAPGALAAKIAQHALGPELSARVAAQLEPAQAAALTKHVKPDFLADIALALDPSRSAAVLAAIPDELVIKVGRLVLKRREYVVLARFCASFPTDVALAAIADATPLEVLTIGMYTEDDQAISNITLALAKDRLAAMGEEALAAGRLDDLVALLSKLSPAALQHADVLPARKPEIVARAEELGFPDLFG